MKTILLSFALCVISVCGLEAQSSVSVYVHDQADTALVIDSVKISGKLSNGIDLTKEIPYKYDSNPSAATSFALYFPKKDVPAGLVLSCEYSISKNKAVSTLSNDTTKVIQPSMNGNVITGFQIYNSNMKPQPVNGKMTVSVNKPGKLKFMQGGKTIPNISFTVIKSTAQGPDTDSKINSTDSANGAKEMLAAIKDKFPDFKENKPYYKGDTLFVFLDSTLKDIPGTALPDCFKGGKYVHVAIVVPIFNPADSVFLKDANHSRWIAKITYDEFGGNDLTILNTGAIQSKEKIKYDFLPEDPHGPFNGGVKITAQLADKKTDKIVTREITLSSCDDLYHVAIMGGFYYSTLNQPDNITTFVKPNGDTTLVGDHTHHTLAVTVSAIFYPIPRSRYYTYRDLSFWQKWSVCFGLKVSQNPFENIFLGLNYEFSKGGNFTAGFNYGQHKVVGGYNNFNFGQTVYHGPFDNSKMKTQYDLAWYIGVNIDFRVIHAMITNIQNDTDLSSSKPKENESKK